MFAQDYFMRQIKQLADALERVLFKKREGNQQEALEIIEQSLKELFGVKDQNFKELSLENTISALEYKGRFNAELAFIVAELLFEQAELTHNSDSKKSYMQSLLLFKFAMRFPEAAFPIEASEKIAFLDEQLSSSDLAEISRILK